MNLVNQHLDVSTPPDIERESYKSERIIFFRFSVTYLPEPAANSFFFQSNMKRHYHLLGNNFNINFPYKKRGKWRGCIVK